MVICLLVWNMAFMTFHSVGNVIIPSDFHQRGRYTTNQWFSDMFGELVRLRKVAAKLSGFPACLVYSQIHLKLGSKVGTQVIFPPFPCLDQKGARVASDRFFEWQVTGVTSDKFSESQVTAQPLQPWLITRGYIPIISQWLSLDIPIISRLLIIRIARPWKGISIVCEPSKFLDNASLYSVFRCISPWYPNDHDIANEIS